MTSNPYNEMVEFLLERNPGYCIHYKTHECYKCG